MTKKLLLPIKAHICGVINHTGERLNLLCFHKTNYGAINSHKPVY